jgi:hypothetical protein
MRTSIAVIMFCAVGCADSDPTLDGTYRGDGDGGMFPAEWRLTIDKLASPDASVTGSYRIHGLDLDTMGTIGGTFTDPQLSLVLTATDSSHCGYTITATWSDDDIYGTYVTRMCSNVKMGNVNLTK